MKTVKKTIIFILTAVILISVVPVRASAAFNSALDDLTLHSECIYLESLDDGSVVFEQNADKRKPTASLVKMVTAILTLEACDDLDKVITVPEYAIRALDGTDSSNVGIVPGENISILNLLYCLLVSSANEASTILADYVGGGSIPAFVAKMNEFAKRIGCKNSGFVNTHGLDEEGQYTCARDVALIARYALTFSKSAIFEKITSTSKYTIPATNKYGERSLNSTNYLMNSGYADYYCKYVNGIKTGTTSGAGRCVAARASKDGYSYLVVIMGGGFEDYDHDNYNENGAFLDAKQLLEWSFTNLRFQEVVKANQIVSVVDVTLSRKVDHVRLVPQSPLTLLVPSGTGAQSVLVEPDKKTMPHNVSAPVQSGQEIGEAAVLYAGEEIGRVKLVAAESISRSPILYIGYLLGRLVRTIVFKLLLGVFLLLVAMYVVLFLVVRAKKKRRRKLKVLNYRDIEGK